tara:strand:+ start:410 stop:1522 length:1113 start_codon:yes stop_codon:yes gene_type:complete
MSINQHLLLSTVAFSCSLALGATGAMASPSQGLKNGSFCELSKNGWQYTQYLSDPFQFVVDIENESETNRGAYVHMQVDRLNGYEDSFPSKKPRLIQNGITLDSCGDLANVVLQFDYRSTGVTGFYGLMVELKAMEDMNIRASKSHQLLGMSVEDAIKDPNRGWSTAQLALELPTGSSADDFQFDVEFTVLCWGADTPAGSFCGVAFPLVDLDEVSLAAVSVPGDALPERASICGDGFSSQLGVNIELVSLVTEDVEEPDINPIFRHRIIDPDIPIVCGDGGMFEGPCLYELTTTTMAYDPALMPCQADLNGDGRVGGADLALLLVEWGSTGSTADLNCDLIVNGGDLSLLLSDWGFCNPTAGLMAPPSL